MPSRRPSRKYLANGLSFDIIKRYTYVSVCIRRAAGRESVGMRAYRGICAQRGGKPHYIL